MNIPPSPWRDSLASGKFCIYQFSAAHWRGAESGECSLHTLNQTKLDFRLHSKEFFFSGPHYQKNVYIWHFLLLLWLTTENLLLGPVGPSSMIPNISKKKKKQLWLYFWLNQSQHKLNISNVWGLFCHFRSAPQQRFSCSRSPYEVHACGSQRHTPVVPRGHRSLLEHLLLICCTCYRFI